MEGNNGRNRVHVTNVSHGSDMLEYLANIRVMHTDHRMLFMIQNCGTQGHTRMHIEPKPLMMWVMHVQNEMHNDSQLHTKCRGQWWELIRYAEPVWPPRNKHSTQCRCTGAHPSDTHTTTTVHIYGDMRTLLPYNGHNVVMSKWTTNSSLFYPEDGDKFSFISANFFHTAWLHIPFSIILYHNNLTSWNLTFHGTMVINWMTKNIYLI